MRYALSDVVGAEQAFRRAAAFHPRSAPALNNLAQALADQSRFDEAETTVRRALELDIDERTRASLLRTLNDIAEARTAR